MNFALLVFIFVLAAGAERIWEMKASRHAMRGQRHQGWSFVYFAVLHTVIFLGTALECFVLGREPVWWLTCAGLVLFAVSLAVRLAAIRTLGRFWSLHLEIRSGHRLVTEGIYSYMRHPAYTAIMIEVVSVPLVGNAYGMALLALLTYVPVLVMRWSMEEKAMIAQMGDAYRRYCKAVPAFLPWRGRCDVSAVNQAG